MRLRRAAALRGDPFLADMAERELATERAIWRVADVVLYPFAYARAHFATAALLAALEDAG